MQYRAPGDPGGDQGGSATNTDTGHPLHQEVPTVKKCVQNHRRLVKTPYMPLPQMIGSFYPPPLRHLLINTVDPLLLHPPVDLKRPIHKLRQGGERRWRQHKAQGKPEKPEIMVPLPVKWLNLSRQLSLILAA